METKKELSKEQSEALFKILRSRFEKNIQRHNRELQKFGNFDTKTSSWILTPSDIREKGGAIYCDFRYGHVFVNHNDAESYYAARGFRGFLMV